MKSAKSEIKRIVFFAGLAIALLIGYFCIWVYMTVSNDLAKTDYTFADLARYKLQVYQAEVSSDGKYFIEQERPTTGNKEHYSFSIYDMNTFELLGKTEFNQPPKGGRALEFRGWDSHNRLIMAFINNSYWHECVEKEAWAVSPSEGVAIKTDCYATNIQQPTKLADCWDSSKGTICYKTIEDTRYMSSDSLNDEYNGLEISLNGQKKTVGWWQGPNALGFNDRGDLVYQGAGELAQFTVIKHDAILRLF